MYLGAYDFTGDPDALLAAYERMMAMVPPGASDLHLCAVRRDGMSIFDTCPSEAVFDAFSTGPDFAAAREAAGLPEPVVRKLGEVRRARLSHEV